MTGLTRVRSDLIRWITTRRSETRASVAAATGDGKRRRKARTSPARGQTELGCPIQRTSCTGHRARRNELIGATRMTTSEDDDTQLEQADDGGGGSPANSNRRCRGRRRRRVAPAASTVPAKIPRCSSMAERRRYIGLKLGSG
jgi:hypothetical protein